MFKLKGVIVGQGALDDDLSLDILDLGAQDIDQSDEVFVVTTDPSSMLNVKNAIENQNLTINSAEVAKVADTELEISDSAIQEKILKLISKLEDDDDITDVYTNCNI
jgi:transcriptional/translational regulatory protein YebC/TACO1